MGLKDEPKKPVEWGRGGEGEDGSLGSSILKGPDRQNVFPQRSERKLQ